MASVSDRALFLEMIKVRPMSINDVIDQFGVARNTARAWISHSEVELVTGSYPRQYRRKNSTVAEMPEVEIPTKQTRNEYVIKWPRPPKAILEELFDKVLDGEVPDFNFTQQFQEVNSAEHLRSIKVSLMTGLLLVEHYEKIRKDEGMD